MKDAAIFINTSRGEVVDEPALIKAIKSKGVKSHILAFLVHDLHGKRQENRAGWW